MAHETMNIRGLEFSLQGDGFRHGSLQDFELIASNVEDRLLALPAPELARLHAGSIFGDEGPADQAAYDDLYLLAYEEGEKVLATWAKPEGASLMISAVP